MRKLKYSKETCLNKCNYFTLQVWFGVLDLGFLNENNFQKIRSKHENPDKNDETLKYLF